MVLRQHEDKFQSVLSCFDRLIFRGYLPWVSYPSAMERFLDANGALLKDFKPFVLTRPNASRSTLATPPVRPGVHSLERDGLAVSVSRS